MAYNTDTMPSELDFGGGADNRRYGSQGRLNRDQNARALNVMLIGINA
jgi:hypothetical protein